MQTAHSVTLNVQLDLLACVIGMNIFLTFCHWALYSLREKFGWRWGDSALAVIDFLLNMIGWFAAMRMPARSAIVEAQKEMREQQQAQTKK